MLKQALVGLGVLPTRLTWRNPFKIVEYEELLNGVEIQATDVILDLGCGAGLQDLLLARKAARVVGIDVSPAQIAHARTRAARYARGRNLEYRCTSLEAAGFAPRQFDKVVSFCVLEHIVNRDEVLDAVAEVLKPGGMLLISVDSLSTVTDPSLVAKHRADHAVLTYFTPAEIQAMLAARGFGDIRVWPIFRSPYAKRLFEDGIRGEFRYGSCAKFGMLAQLKVHERRHRREERGVFLCATGVRRP